MREPPEMAVFFFCKTDGRNAKTSCNRPSDDNAAVPVKVCPVGNLDSGFGSFDHRNGE